MGRAGRNCDCVTQRVADEGTVASPASPASFASQLARDSRGRKRPLYQKQDRVDNVPVAHGSTGMSQANAASCGEKLIRRGPLDYPLARSEGR